MIREITESRLTKVNLTEDGKRLIEEFDRELDEKQEVELYCKSAFFLCLYYDRILILDLVKHIRQRRDCHARKDDRIYRLWRI